MAYVRTAATPQEKHEAQYRNWDPTEFAELETDQRPTRHTRDRDIPSPFKDLIQRDPVVCDHCFVHRYEVVAREWWRGSFGWMEAVRWLPRPGRSVEVPADTPAQGTRLACSNCGHRRSKDRPLSKSRVHEFASNLSETLDFKEIPHDRDVLFMEVDDRNTSENQGRQDSHVFAPAVKHAIRQQ